MLPTRPLANSTATNHLLYSSLAKPPIDSIDNYHHAKMLATARNLAKTGRTFRLRHAYGEKPLLSKQEYEQAKQSGELDQYAFRPVRFAKIDENNSLLQNPLHHKFLQFAMRNGRKAEINRISDDAFYLIKTYQLRKLQKRDLKQQHQTSSSIEEPDIILDPMEILIRAIENCKPLVITKKVKRGGATYQVPFPLDAKQSEYFSIKWLISAVKDRPRPKKRSYHEHLAQELIDAANNEGKVIKKRDDIHKLAEANKAYSHYRWG